MLNVINEKKEKIICSVIVLSIVYFLTNWFMLFATGTWWDEKTWFFSTNEKMWDTSLQLGKPVSYFLQRFMNDTPEWVGRSIIFITFYIALMGMYVIYNQLPFINNNEATLITLIYIAIPANDAKIMRAIYPYSFGYCLFIIGFVLLIFLQEKYQYEKFFLRVITLIFFFWSFILNSNLVFYSIILIYILYFVIKNNKIKVWYKFLDFVVLPFFFYGFKTLLFPTYGVYADYNHITVQDLLVAIIRSGGTSKLCLINVIKLWGKYVLLGCVPAAIVGLIWLMTKAGRKAENTYDSKIDIKKNIDKFLTLAIIGAVTIYVGVYAYDVVGQYCKLTGVSGRSSILLCIGMAILFYSFVSLIPYNQIKILICIIISVCGICHFNYFYLLYQQDYYRQMDLIYELKENENVLSERKNILYLTDYESEINATRFYSLNENGREAFGDQTHFIMNGINDIHYLLPEEGEVLYGFVNNGDYQMSEYQIGISTEVDAIIVYNNNITVRDTLSMKIEELTNRQKFLEHIYRDKNMQIVLPDQPEFYNLLGCE